MTRTKSRSAAKLVIAPGFGLAVFVAACGGGVGSTEGGAPIAFDRLGETIAQKLCPAIANCCSQNGYAEDHASCPKIGPLFQAAYAKDKAKYDLVYDAQAAGDCVAQIVSAYSTCSLGPSSNPEVCDGVLRGRRQPGDSCEHDEECGPGMECSMVIVNDVPKPGICYRMKRSPSLGDSCLDLGTDAKPDPSKTYARCGYSDGFYCDPASNTCKPRGGPGTGCVITTDATTYVSQAVCDETSYCDNETKKCERRPDVGGDCRTSGACRKGAYCDFTTNKCAAVKAPGERCDEQNSDACEHGCDAHSRKCRSNDVPREMCSGNVD